MTKLLFVCLGNICRSPAAEGVMKKMVSDKNLSEKIFCDSAGTSAHHIGELPDPRMQNHALDRGYTLDSSSRPFIGHKDFIRYDYIFTMDPQNFDDVCKQCPDKKMLGKVIPMIDMCQTMTPELVPDPYFRGEDGFALVMDILEDACDGILLMLEREGKV